MSDTTNAPAWGTITPAEAHRKAVLLQEARIKAFTDGNLENPEVFGQGQFLGQF